LNSARKTIYNDTVLYKPTVYIYIKVVVETNFQILAMNIFNDRVDASIKRDFLTKKLNSGRKKRKLTNRIVAGPQER
jgi:hypothetical protein